MASDAASPFPSAGARAGEVRRPWRGSLGLSIRTLAGWVHGVEAFLEARPFERAPWLVVAFGSGIAAWFMLGGAGEWLALLFACAAVAAGTVALLVESGALPQTRRAIAAMALIAAAGCVTVWSKSELVGATPVGRPMVTTLSGRIVAREERGAEGRVRLTLITRALPAGAARVRINLPARYDDPQLIEGAVVRLRARLMPPAPPMLPGAYDFARTAWFQGLAATGSALGPAEVVETGRDRSLASVQRVLAAHVRDRLDGTPGTIAAAFASGDRGAISAADEQAMRDSGLTHLLSISGLHVSAVIGAAYILAMRLLALWPWLALRVRLPLVAAATAALTGLAYTLLTGAEVPTVRSCIGALLVLAALALGRDPLSLRMVAAAAFFVMVFWPEAVVGPSFQMSFAAVLSIVALHQSAPIKRFLARRDHDSGWRVLRLAAMLLLTGVVIELALMPIGLFHFHRAGLYGALANVIAIPLTTFVSMPLIALALLLDLVGAGAPAWWLAGKSLELLLALAHWTAAQPGAVVLLPTMGRVAFALFLAGGLWLALWSGRVRLWGLVPIAIGVTALASLRPPDVLVSGDGRHVGIVGAGAGGERSLLVLRASRSRFAADNLRESAGMDGEPHVLDRWPGARCSRDFCTVVINRGGRRHILLLARSRDLVGERELAAACERADIVVADRRLPMSCRPRRLKADRRLLAETGGLAIDLEHGTVATVAETQGRHGWYRWPEPKPRPTSRSASPPAS